MPSLNRSVRIAVPILMGYWGVAMGYNLVTKQYMHLWQLLLGSVIVLYGMYRLIPSDYTRRLTGVILILLGFALTMYGLVDSTANNGIAILLAAIATVVGAVLAFNAFQERTQ